MPVPQYGLPRPVEQHFMPNKTELDKSLSHTQYVDHWSKDNQELYEPVFVKLDKQVSFLTAQPRVMACHTLQTPVPKGAIFARFSFTNLLILFN